MVRDVIMPKIGETMEEGFLANWKKNEGDKVEKGEVLFEVMSDKANFEIESLHAGYLIKKVVQASDEPVAVTTVIGYIGDSLDEPLPVSNTKDILEQKNRLKVADDSSPVQTTEGGQKEVTSGDIKHLHKIKVTPIARRLAKEYSLDLSNIEGTGPDGRIEKKDIIKLVDENKKIETIRGGTEEYDIQEWTPLRRIIAKRLSESKREIPHYYIQGKFLLDEIIKLRDSNKLNKSSVTYTDFLIFIASRAIKDHPLINVGVYDKEIRLYRNINIGLAVAVTDGLVVPVIKKCEIKNIFQISEDRERLVSKARDNKLTEEDINGVRFIISNLGMYGVENFQPIINQPGVAIMGVGKIGKEPVVVGDDLKIHSIMNISFSFDHRIIDGSYAGLFYSRFKELVENPALLMFQR
jgi:pyruvate dehydrogenase E2 component (dihydrolipoamide acetyltransferase)